MELTPRMKRSIATARDAAAQSIVLLKNTENTLPLVSDDPFPIALFGVGQIRTVRGGTGSGEVNILKELCLLDALQESEALVPDALLARKYRSWCLAHKDATKGSFMGPSQHYNDEMPLDELDWDCLTENAQAALMVISRVAGEGADMEYGPGTLALTEAENAMIQAVTARFDRTVLILNTPGYVELADVLPRVGAVLFLGLPGQEGGRALADILTGAVSPSGHLSDTWPVRYGDYACADYYGDGPENGIQHTGMMGQQRQIDVAYHDDIFVGYRYFDTFGIPVQFPFGYGLTYGAPRLTGVAAGYADGMVSLTAEVTNASETYPCRAVVQVYASAPTGKLDQPFQRLAAFGKTRLLAPGESQTMQITFPMADLASYDMAKASYVLEAGYYDLRVGFDSRATQVAGSLYLPKAVVTQKLSSRFGRLPADFELLTSQGASPITYSGEAQELSAARAMAIRVSDRAFVTRQAAYPKTFTGCISKREDAVTLYDVKNGDAALYDVVARMTTDELCQLVCGTGMDMSGIMGMGTEEGPPLPEGMELPPMGESVSFDVPGAAGQTADLWDEYRIPHLTLSDGPAGLRLTPELKNEDGDVVRRQICTAFPTGSLLACSWDPEVLKAVGQAVGEEMNELRVDLWLAPGMNLHRSPLCGRNFEYYSEDPLLCGQCAAAITRGVQSNGGAGVTLKHFAGNNQEYLRDCSNDIVSERALRELYLKGFEIAVRTAAPKAIMTSYNDIMGVPAANNYDLCTAVLRGEWGFDGLVMTDWGGGISHPALSMWAGNDMIQPGGQQSIALVRQALDTEVENPGAKKFSQRITRPMLEQSALHILGVVLRSEAFRRRIRGAL